MVVFFWSPFEREPKKNEYSHKKQICVRIGDPLNEQLSPLGFPLNQPRN